MAKKPYLYAQMEGVHSEMRKNKDMVFIYQSEPAASLPTGQVLSPWKEFGEPRTSGVGWALDEMMYVGCATGIALTGVPVLVEIPAMTTTFPFEYIHSQVSMMRYATGGVASVPIVIWMDAAGRRKASGPQHNDSGHECLYANIPGIKIVVPSDAYDAKGLMIAAIRDPDPVLYFDYTDVASGEPMEVPDDAYEVPIGKAAVRQEGKDLTIVAWAPSTIEVAKALPDLSKAGISVEYIDLRTIKPMDTDTIVASVKKTGRLLVVEQSNYTHGFGADVVAEVAQKVRGALLKRIAFPDAWGPMGKDMMTWMKPDAPKIVDAAKRIMKL